MFLQVCHPISILIPRMETRACKPCSMPEGKRGRGQKRGGLHRMACLVASGQAGPPGVARGRASEARLHRQ
eukprot:4617118-Lingulodinium_polyedra.AAC.1